MNILKRIKDFSMQDPERVAVRTGSMELTYGQLWMYSERLAGWIRRSERETAAMAQEPGNERTSGAPVAVYGHKHPWMLVCFLACVKSGHAYCPIDTSVPDARVRMILETLPSRYVLTTESLQAEAGDKSIITLEQLKKIVGQDSEYSSAGDGADFVDDFAWVQGSDSVDDSAWVQGSDIWYIIFTSGSTGVPKGVQISADCLNHYLDWSVGLGSSEEQKQGQVFLNQAPFSFDLSVMDLYTSLACGGTLYCLEKAVQSDYRMLMKGLRESDVNVWVSTPSFAEVCLAEKGFSADWMPKLEVFLFCGETLTNKTAGKLQSRFPDAKIINTYGPTESTVAVTEVLVTPELVCQENPLPVGRPKQGTWIEIHSSDGRVLPEGEKGEIIIIGNTVSPGYYEQEELTKGAFFEVYREDGQITDAPAIRGYRTGDKGYLQDGMLYYCGRIDLQIKLHGYRIELEDIENNLRKLAGVEHAVVLPNSRGGDKITSLTGYLVLRAEQIMSLPDENGRNGIFARKADRKESGRFKEALQEYLPDYMIPKKFVILNQMPMTGNGKADRKRLGGLKL